MEAIGINNINVFLPEIDGDEQDTAPEIIKAMPFSIISSMTEVLVNGKPTRGRQYSWGVAEVENPEHCDFVHLRNLIIR
jgi:septin family protein